MCFKGISDIDMNISHKSGKAIPILFCEELGLILEVMGGDVKHCLTVFEKYHALLYKIGKSVAFGMISKIAKLQ